MDRITLKKSLRKAAKAARMELTRDEIETKSLQIFESWKSAFPIDHLSLIHLFLSIEKFNEVNTQPFLEHIQSFSPKVLPVVPVTDFEQDILTHIAISPEIEIERNDWGIPEPKIHKRKVSPSELDMVLVPLLAFDKHCNRLGYGKGHYDNFLVQTRPDCLKIGICFEVGKLDQDIPVEPHDFPLDAVITEAGIYVKQ